MVDKYKPTRESIIKLLNTIEQRIVSNNEKPWKQQEYKSKL